MHRNAIFSVKTDPFVEMQRSEIPVETNSCECGLNGFVRSWIKAFLWKLLCIETSLYRNANKVNLCSSCSPSLAVRHVGPLFTKTSREPFLYCSTLKGNIDQT